MQRQAGGRRGMAAWDVHPLRPGGQGSPAEQLKYDEEGVAGRFRDMRRGRNLAPE
jgi:hypothetical protein